MTNTPNDWTDNDLEQLSRIAPNAGAPSEWEELQMEAIHGAVARGYCHEGNRHKELDGTLLKAISIEVSALLDAECKAAAAAALEQAAEHIPEQSHEATGYLIRCACGWKSLAYKVDWRIEDGSSRGFSEWQQHIRALSPDPNYIALREADARIAEANTLYTNWNIDESIRNFDTWFRKHIAALTEARDKLVKK